MDPDDLLALLDLDLAVRDELGAADVEVVAASVSEVLHEETAVVAVELEADLLETVEDVLVELSDLLGRLEVELADEFGWQGCEEDVSVLERWSTFLVEAIQPCWETVLRRDDVGGGSLDDGRVCAVLVEFAGVSEKGEDEVTTCPAGLHSDLCFILCSSTHAAMSWPELQHPTMTAFLPSQP